MICHKGECVIAYRLMLLLLAGNALLKAACSERTNDNIHFWVNKLHLLSEWGNYPSDRNTKSPTPLHKRKGIIEQKIVSYKLKAFPILIEKIASKKWCKNKIIPFFRCREGDAAFFFLMDWMGGNFDPFRAYLNKEMLRDFDKRGTIAYFHYVDYQNKRFELIKSLRNWWEDNKGKLFQESDGCYSIKK